MYSKQTRKAYRNRNWKTPPQPNRPTKTRKDPHLNTLPREHTQQPKQRKGEDATNDKADSRPTQKDASKTSSGRKVAGNTEQTKSGGPQRTRKNKSCRGSPKPKTQTINPKTPKRIAFKHQFPPREQQTKELCRTLLKRQRWTRRSS